MEPFNKEEQYKQFFKHEIDRGDMPAEMPADWPNFHEGEMVLLKGHPFTVQRINAASIVLRPVTEPGKNVRTTIREMVR